MGYLIYPLEYSCSVCKSKHTLSPFLFEQKLLQCLFCIIIAPTTNAQLSEGMQPFMLSVKSFHQPLYTERAYNSVNTTFLPFVGGGEGGGEASVEQIISGCFDLHFTTFRTVLLWWLFGRKNYKVMINNLLLTLAHALLITLGINAFSSPEPTILLACGGDRELWLHPVF